MQAEIEPPGCQFIAQDAAWSVVAAVEPAVWDHAFIAQPRDSACETGDLTLDCSGVEVVGIGDHMQRVRGNPGIPEHPVSEAEQQEVSMSPPRPRGPSARAVSPALTTTNARLPAREASTVAAQ